MTIPFYHYGLGSYFDRSSVKDKAAYLPEFGSDLVAALSGLKMNDLSHDYEKLDEKSELRIRN